jgi:tight adherence protein C
MNIIVLLIGLALLGFALILFVRAFSFSRVRAVGTLGQIGSYGYLTPGLPDGPARTSIFGVLATRLGAIAAPRFGLEREARMRELLQAAGFYSLEPRRFLGYRVLIAVALPIFRIWLAIVGGSAGVFFYLTLPLIVLGGWYLPLRYVKMRARKRLNEIDAELPELIDLLVVTVEAGLGFVGALKLSAERLGGPLGEEIRLTLQEQAMGLSSSEALRNMQRRTDTPGMQSFVRSVLQGETLGVPTAEIMRSLAGEMRKRRRALAEEKAQKAPIKILFPLVFLIFPAMLIVILAPAVYVFLHTFSAAR